MYKPFKRRKAWHTCQYITALNPPTNTWSSYPITVYCRKPAHYYVRWNQATWFYYGFKQDEYLATQQPQWVCEEHYGMKQGLYGDTLYVKLIAERAK